MNQFMNHKALKRRARHQQYEAAILKGELLHPRKTLEDQLETYVRMRILDSKLLVLEEEHFELTGRYE